MENKILIATTNQGKFNIYKAVFDELGLDCTNLAELKVSADVDENGKNELENAIIKAEAYHKLTGLPVLANDSGLVIEKFSEENQPKALVRRYQGRELSDDEMIEVYSQKLKEVGGESEGHYNVALAIIDENGNLFTREFQPKRYFVSSPSKVVNKGVPLSSLAYDKVSGKYMSEMTTVERNAYEAEAMQLQKQFIAEVFVK